MTKAEFQTKEQRAVTLLMESVEITEGLLKSFASLATGATPVFTLDPDYAAAGTALQAVVDTLGTGPTSNRAKLDKIR